MASLFKKIWSGLDFWDREENRRQREQFAQEDEEERRRREREAAARRQLQPGTVVQPEQVFDPEKPLAKAGAQSDFSQPLPKYKNILEAIGDKFEGNSPQDIAKREAAGQPRTYEEQVSNSGRGSGTTGLTNFVRRNFNPKGLLNIAKSVGQGIIRTPEEVARTGLDIGLTALEKVPGPGREYLQSEEGRAFKEDIRSHEYKSPVMRALYGSTPAESYFKTGEELTSAAEQLTGKKLPKATGPLAGGALLALDIFTGKKASAVSKELAGQATARGVKDVLEREGVQVADDVAESIAKNTNAKQIETIVKKQGQNLAQEGAGTGLRKAPSEDKPVIPGALQKADADQTPTIAVGDGIKSTNLAKQAEELAEEASNINVPAYQRVPAQNALEKVKLDLADARAREMGVGESPLDRPAFQHKQQIEDIIQQGDDELDNFVRENPGATIQQIDEAKLAIADQVKKQVDELERARYGAKTTSIPDVSNTQPLIKVADQTEGLAPEVPIADFRQAENGSLRKAAPIEEPVAVAPTVQPEVAVDAAGNPVLKSDTAVQRELVEQGMAPQRGASPLATEEAARVQAANRAAREQVDLEGAAAPRTREQAANRISDEDLRADVLENFPEKQTVNIEETQNIAKQKVNNLADDELVARYAQDVRITEPEGYFTAVESIRRLERIGTPEAQAAVRRAIDAIAEFSSSGGRTLRVVQTLFDDMPTAMKVDYLMDKLGKAGAELNDVDRTRLVALIEGADVATDKLRVLEGQAQELIDSGVINNKSLPRGIKKQVRDLVDEISQARLLKEEAAGEAWKDYQRHLPKNPLGKRAADVGRTAMLSAPSGRAFDILSTTATSLDDIITGGVSNLIGKVLNKIPGVAPGKFSETLVAPGKLVKGFGEGVERTAKSFAGKDYVEDFLGEAKRATRGDIQTGGSKIRQVVRAAVEMPTNLSRGLREQSLFRQGVKEAKQQGLQGRAAKVYAELRASIPSKDQFREATQAHLRANMLHDNKISRGLNMMARALDKGGKGWGAVFIRNQVAPFTSWLGGNLHRTLTDKNVLFNVGSAVKNATKGNWQGVVDDVSKFAVNSGEAYAIGMLLSKAGIITTEDANGDSYGGLYFHIGDRYIPVAAAGLFSVPIVWGNAIQQSIDAARDGEENPVPTFFNALVSNTAKNAGVSSVFGGENNLQSTIKELLSENGDVASAASQYIGDLVRQYIPGVLGDVNSFLYGAGESPETRVTFENPETGREKTDVFATEVNKTKARIPGLAGSLPRKEGTAAKDVMDRILKSNRETETQVAEREETKSKEEVEKDREERGIPKTDDGIQAAIEDGDWDKAIEGYQWELERASEDEEVSEKTKQGTKDKIKVLEVTRDGDYDPSVIELYKSTGLEEWRDMGDPESEDYDPVTFDLLSRYDAERAKFGVSEYDKDHSKTRYYSKDSKRGGGKGSTAKTPKFLTDIARQSMDYSFRPLKAESATFGPRKSAVPIVEPVPNYDRSKLKKISVAKGARR